MCVLALACSASAQPADTPQLDDANPEHVRLELELGRYRVIERAGGWPLVPAGPTIGPGASGARVVALAERLAASGDLPQTPSSTSVFDDALEAAVRTFQYRHGLVVDGLVGRRTLAALNTAVERRIEQLEANIERLRNSVPHGDGIHVNIPAFEVRLLRGGETVWRAKAIVGTLDDQTPEFDAGMTHVTLNPTWTVPRRITVEEKLPEMLADPSFFDRGGYRLYDPAGNEVRPADVDWSTMTEDRFPYTLVQMPGPGNALGQVKFVFPNEYSICMHDTPAKALFRAAVRTESHGCVRVDEPLALAAELLAAEEWSTERIREQVASGETLTIVLPEAVPVTIHYRTVSVDGDGVVRFFDDVYERDAAVARAREAL